MHIGYTITTKLQDLVEVAAIRVAVGDSVSAGQVVMELNSSRPGEKLILKCPDTGTVRSICFKVGGSFAGDKVTLLSLDIKDRTSLSLDIKDRTSLSLDIKDRTSLSLDIKDRTSLSLDIKDRTSRTSLDDAVRTSLDYAIRASSYSSLSAVSLSAVSAIEAPNIPITFYGNPVANYDAFRELIVEKENLYPL